MKTLKPGAVVLLLGFAAACTPVPSLTPSSAGDSVAATAVSTAPTQQPTPITTPRATAVEGAFGSQWEPVELGTDDAAPHAAAYGGGGAVIVGATCVGSAEAPDCTAAAWRQDNDGGWSEASVEDAAGATMVEVVFRAHFVALGWRIERGGALVRALIWTSPDGRHWTLDRSVQIGDCSGEGPPCGHAAGLVVTQGGLIVLSDVYAAGDGGFTGGLVSGEDKQWSRIEPSSFGGEPDASIAAAVATDDGMVALVRSGTEPMSVWRAANGLAWQRLGRLGEITQGSGSLASNGTLIVAVVGESAPEGFRTTVWTSTGNRPFAQTGLFEDIALPKVAYAGELGFLAIGHDQGRPQVVASSDGQSWYRTAPGLPQVDCGPSWLAAGPAGALYIGECRIVWRAVGP